MANLSDYLAGSWLNMLEGQAFTAPPALYLALFTSSTGLQSNLPVGEVSGNSYARQLLTLTAPVLGSCKNTSDVVYPMASGYWGTISHVAIVDHPTNVNWGVNVNVLLWVPLAAFRLIELNDIFKILSGDLTVSLG